MHINWSMVTCKGSTRYWNYLEDYWPCAGGLSAVNAFGTQLGDPINPELILWHMAADHEQDLRPYPVESYSSICNDPSYIHGYGYLSGSR